MHILQLLVLFNTLTNKKVKEYVLMECSPTQNEKSVIIYYADVVSRPYTVVISENYFTNLYEVFLR